MRVFFSFSFITIIFVFEAEADNKPVNKFGICLERAMWDDLFYELDLGVIQKLTAGEAYKKKLFLFRWKQLKNS